MKPRSHSDPAPKPASTAACVSSVRRVHAHSGPTLPCAPAINRTTAGLCRRYVQAHGAAALMPSRKEPLKKEHLVAIYRVADGTPLRRSRKVHWASVFFTSWRAFTNTTRTTGSRKDGLLELSASSFTRGSMSRANLRWRICGVIYANVTRELLARLALGDAAVLIPGCSKSDPFALFVGSSPMYLPYAPDDNTNAAAALRDLELAAPISGARRSRVPLFVCDESFRPLTHAQADDAFDALSALALDPAVARTLSLRSGRVFLASALKALGFDDPDIQAFVRWRDPASIAIYAHREPDECIATLSQALDVDITSVLTKNLPTCDNDPEVARLQRTQFPDNIDDDATPTDDEHAAHAEQQAALVAAPHTAAPQPAAPPLAGLRMPDLGAAPATPVCPPRHSRTRPSSQHPARRTRAATSRPAPRSPSSSTRRTPRTSAAPCEAIASGMCACSSPTATPSTSTTSSCIASSRRTAHASRPVTERFALGPSGHSPPLLLFGLLPASDEGQGPKAAPEAE